MEISESSCSRLLEFYCTIRAAVFQYFNVLLFCRLRHGLVPVKRSEPEQFASRTSKSTVLHYPVLQSLYMGIGLSTYEAHSREIILLILIKTEALGCVGYTVNYRGHEHQNINCRCQKSEMSKNEIAGRNLYW